MRRRADGGVAVAVRVRGRPMAAVLADLVEGVVVANRDRLDESEEENLRQQLSAVLDVDPPAAAARAA